MFELFSWTQHPISAMSDLVHDVEVVLGLCKLLIASGNFF